MKHEMTRKYFGSDLELRSYFSSHYPMIFGVSTRFSMPSAMHDLVDRFATELTTTRNDYVIRDLRWQSMRLFFNRGSTPTQLEVSQKYIDESARISANEDVYASSDEAIRSAYDGITCPSQYVTLELMPAAIKASFQEFLKAESYPRLDSIQLAYRRSFKEFLKHHYPRGAEHQLSCSPLNCRSE